MTLDSPLSDLDKVTIFTPSVYVALDSKNLAKLTVFSKPKTGSLSAQSHSTVVLCGGRGGSPAEWRAEGMSETLPNTIQVHQELSESQKDASL